MIELVSNAQSTHGHGELATLTERLLEFAREMEAAGLPWAASGVRNVAGMVATERQVAGQIAA